MGKECGEAYEIMRKKTDEGEMQDILQEFAVTFPSGPDAATHQDLVEIFENYQMGLEDQVRASLRSRVFLTQFRRQLWLLFIISTPLQ